ncbi:MAG: sorbosone dehydrogenase family protein [Pseudomonadota bacterium]
MTQAILTRVSALALLLTQGACASYTSNTGPAASPPASLGPAPALPQPRTRLLPAIRIAEATGWASGSKPLAASGLTVKAYASGLQHPRWLYSLPNGDVLVAETNAPPRPDEGKGIRGRIMKSVMTKAGAAVPSANRITLLRDTDGDGAADLSSPFIEGLNSPFGMALVGSTLYVANTDAVLAFPYRVGELRIEAKGNKVTDLPAGPRNHHWTKNILASEDGRYLYATVGSNSNIGENGIAAEEGRAAIWQIDLASGAKRLYATGLRNPNGMAWESSTGMLWTVANERDELGNDLVPDYLSSVHDGAFYGWPYSYYGQQVDRRVKPQDPALVAKALAPDYALGAHVAVLGLAAATGSSLPSPFTSGMFIAEHGSWNRKPLAGYKVVFVSFAAGRPTGQPVDVLTEFVTAHGNAMGRPVGLALDSRGALLVADDVGNTIWRLQTAP